MCVTKHKLTHTGEQPSLLTLDQKSWHGVSHSTPSVVYSNAVRTNSPILVKSKESEARSAGCKLSKKLSFGRAILVLCVFSKVPKALWGAAGLPCARTGTYGASLLCDPVCTRLAKVLERLCRGLSQASSSWPLLARLLRRLRRPRYRDPPRRHRPRNRRCHRRRYP